VETKLLISAIIRGEDYTIAKSYSITEIMLHYISALLHNALGLWKKVVASESYCSGHNEAIIATCSYCYGNILAVIAPESYCSDC
jgi:hypothetical protein